MLPAFNAPLSDQLAVLPDCQRNANYLANIGRLLTAQGQYTDALEHLERALMLEPNLPNAQLDYAIALAGAGDLLSASQLIEGILSQPDLPADLRQTLANARQRIISQQNQLDQQTQLDQLNQQNHSLLAGNSPYGLVISTNLRYGHDSNLLGTPNISSLALTTPGGIIDLPLADGSAPRSGAYARADVKLEYTHRQPDGGQWELALGALKRTSPNAPDANTQQTELTVGYSQNPRTPWAAYANTSWVNINTTGGTRYTSQGMAAGLQLPLAPGACTAKAGLDWQNRAIASNPVLSGYYAGLNAVLACTAEWGGQWQIIGKLGHDRPKDANRPGGNQTLASLRGVGLWPTAGLGLTGTVLVDVEYNTTRDTSGYSPLLDNDAVRQTRRVSTRLEYQRPLALINQRTLLTLGAEWSGQDANLALFRVRSWGPYAAVRLAW